MFRKALVWFGLVLVVLFALGCGGSGDGEETSDPDGGEDTGTEETSDLDGGEDATGEETGDTAAGDTAAGDTAAGDTAAGDTAAGDDVDGIHEEEPSNFVCVLPVPCKKAVVSENSETGEISVLNIDDAKCFIQELRDDTPVKIMAGFASDTYSSYDDQVWVVGDGTAVWMRKGAQREKQLSRHEIVDDATLDACLESTDPILLQTCLFGWQGQSYEDLICPADGD